MAIELKARTSSAQVLKVVSVLDNAIDWRESFAELGEDVDEKKERYLEEHNLEDLKFLPDGKPTLFVFKHPNRADVAKRVRQAYAKVISQEKSELFTEVFNTAFIGTEDGFDGAPLEQAERRDNKITERYYQMLMDAGVLEELARVFLKIVNQEKKGTEVKVKK